MKARGSNDKPKRIAVGVVVNSEGKVLIARRIDKEKGADGSTLYWVFPGGGVEENETMFDTVKREVFEKTGYRIQPIEEISKRKHPQIDIFIHYILAELDRSFETLGQIIDTHEIDKCLWVRPEELEDYFTTELDPGVKKYLSNHSCS